MQSAQIYSPDQMFTAGCPHGHSIVPIRRAMRLRRARSFRHGPHCEYPGCVLRFRQFVQRPSLREASRYACIMSASLRNRRLACRSRVRFEFPSGQPFNRTDSRASNCLIVCVIVCLMCLPTSPPCSSSASHRAGELQIGHRRGLTTGCRRTGGCRVSLVVSCRCIQVIAVADPGR
jgi:hypothetical protein